jgi:hypothetical protein
MFKKTIKYTDYNGQEREEEFYFNLSKAEVIEMEVGEAGGYGEMLKRVVAAKDGALIMKTFKELILKSYGIKSPDGKQFMKSEEISRAFEQSEAYSEMFVEICTNTEAAIEFVSRVLPVSEEARVEATKKAAEAVRLEEEKAKTSELPSNT